MSERYAVADYLGYVRLTPAWPAVLGQPLPPTVVERFDYYGHLIERRLVPPAVRVLK